MFSDLNCRTSQLGTTGLQTWCVLVNFEYLAKFEIGQLKMRFTPQPDQLGIKTGGVLKIAGHFPKLLFSDLKCQTSRLGNTGLYTF